MTELNWRDNSKQMFEKLIESLPKSFKPMMKKKMMESIGKKASESGEVTEDIIIEVAKEITPKPFAPIVMTSIEPLMTKK